MSELFQAFGFLGNVTLVLEVFRKFEDNNTSLCITISFYLVLVLLLKAIFTNSASLGRVGHRVAMSVCLSVCISVCLRHRVHFFSRPLIGPEIT